MSFTRVAFHIVLLAFTMFAFGVDVGHWRARDKIATTCVPQPGAELLASHQNRDGVTCEYGRAFGLATKRKKAT